MEEELIQLPELADLREMLAASKEDIDFEIQQDPDLIPQSKLLLKVIDILDEKLAKHKDLDKISERDKIELAAYISFLQNLEDDFFSSSENPEFEEDGDGEEPLNEHH